MCLDGHKYKRELASAISLQFKADVLKDKYSNVMHRDCDMAVEGAGTSLAEATYSRPVSNSLSLASFQSLGIAQCLVMRNGALRLYAVAIDPRELEPLAIRCNVSAVLSRLSRDF